MRLLELEFVARSRALLAEALQLSETAFQQVHALSGLSWGLSIPLTAVLFRLAWLPILYVTNKASKEEQKLAGILKGWRQAYQAQAVMKHPAGTDVAAKKAEAYVQTQLAAKLKDMRKHTKYLGRWSRGALSMSFLPIWFVNADVIRRMSGDDRTILSAFMKTGQEVDTSTVAIEPGLQNESFLWLPSLVEFDQTWVLPLAFAALSGVSVWQIVGKDMKRLQSKVTGMERGEAKTRELMFLQLSQLVAASAFVFPLLIIRGELASAVVLYLIGSVGTQTIQRPLVKYALGIKPPADKLEARIPKLKGEKETAAG
ncbi:hypothetical protein LTR99_003196 [Exophiala xenobiotica]|uniref:YidC/Oxa1 family membrane protein insertase n=1 Tax=Vermiconidia calcicola TaxID=1690605 RepID=A0AAV9QCT6_9PEZI|nr:hypothetical protein LTR41_001543 [Exophiala xenobiotica]KAK5535478.1 hypothetical protein LTR23_008358 [Chaetothyriales sp. CCFEE 6169]KAK5538862.1 hypothetical protein LTR25_004406 [Vermiconidia calcicola]KAK5251158.1 hypothetical protein LTS06_004116 [Exophiala xenobiotica]KAK5268262.1 hypothetical protein LTR96_006809 [Exophiala xenobiotica]